MSFDRIQMEIALQAAVEDYTGMHWHEVSRETRNDLRHTYRVLYTTLDAEAARTGEEAPNTAVIARRAVRIQALRETIKAHQDEINQLHTKEGVRG